jgi:hypothetical protein
MPPYTWSLVSQTGTNSFTVSAAGVVSSSALHVETDSLVIQVSDSVGASSTGAFSVQVSAGAADPYAIRAPQVGDYYLDTTAGIDGSGTFASPWNNLTAARMKTPTAGQALWVRQGSTVTLPDLTSVGAPQLNSGAAGNRIIFCAYPIGGVPANGYESVTISKATTGGVGIGGGDYWDVAKFTMTCLDTLWYLGAGGSAPANNWRFIDCIGSRTDTTYHDNSAVIYTHSSCDYTQVIRGSYSGPIFGTSNRALLFFDYPKHVTVLGVLLNGSDNPIYFKHAYSDPASASNGSLVKNCIIRNASSGRYFGAALNWVTYQNNVFDTCSLAMDESGGGIPGGNNCTLTHNTFYNSSVVMDLHDSGGIATLNTLVGGSGYTNGTYPRVLLTGGTGSSAYADIVVSGGAVTSVTICAAPNYPENLFGAGFTVGDSLSAPAASIGGTGSGFTINVATTQVGSTHINNVLRNNVFKGTARYSDNSSGLNSNYAQNNSVDYSAVDTGVAVFKRNSSTYNGGTGVGTYNNAFPPNGANDVVGTVTFVGGSSGGGSSAAGWALTGGSIGHAAASDGTDCGVNAANLLTVN